MTSQNGDDKSFWDKIARKYAASKIDDLPGYQKTIGQVAELIDKNDHVLELGCGTGSTALRLAPHAAHYLAGDISPEMITIANEKIADAPCSNLQFEEQTIQTTKPIENGYDKILGFNYLHLVADVDATLSQANSLLKKGGLLITKTPCLSDMNFLIGWAIPAMRFFKKAPANIAMFTADELQAKILIAGFSIEVVEFHGTKGKDTRPYIVARKV